MENAQSGEYTHDNALAAIQRAPKEKLIIAIRAIVTTQLWKLSEEELRGGLHAALHNGEATPTEVYNALENGA